MAGTYDLTAARQARVISGNTASVGRSAFTIYKDVNGVRRKALLKIATGTIRARAVRVGEVCFRGSTDVILFAARRE